jgi:hypothetical protein
MRSSIAPSSGLCGVQSRSAKAGVPGGLTWHFARPAVQDLDLEMDVRGIVHEFTI